MEIDSSEAGSSECHTTDCNQLRPTTSYSNLEGPYKSAPGSLCTKSPIFKDTGFFEADRQHTFKVSNSAPTSPSDEPRTSSSSIISDTSTRVRKRRKTTDEIVNERELDRPNICVACGGTASGCHYDLPSCGGCKTFFRRTIVKRVEIECMNTGKDCIKDTDTVQMWKSKRYPCKELGIKCRWCRLMKIFLKGMDPLMIREDDQMVNVADFPIVRKLFSQKDKMMGMDPQRGGISNESTITELLRLDFEHFTLRGSTFNPKLVKEQSLEQYLRSKNMKKEELNYYPSSPKELLKIGKDWKITDVICAIEYITNTEVFQKLALIDQLLVLKHCVLQVKNLQLAYFSCSNSTSTDPTGVRFPDGTTFSSVLEDPAHLSFLRSHTMNLISSLRCLQLHKDEYAILKAMVVCNGALTDLSEDGSRLLNKYRDEYSMLLFGLIRRRVGDEAPSRYQAVISILQTLPHQAQRERNHHLLLHINCTKSEDSLLLNDIYHI